MEVTLIIIISLLAVILIALIGSLVVLGLKYFKLKEAEIQMELRGGKSNTQKASLSPEVQAEVEKLKSFENAGLNCVDHLEVRAKGICALSGEALCELCLSKQEDIKVGRKYLDIYTDSEWDKVLMIDSKSLGADRLNELLKLKKELWGKQKRPLIIQDQFKINIENDEIESYKVVLARVEDKSELLSNLSFLN